MIQQGITRGLVPLENLVDHNRDSLGEFARAIDRCFRINMTNLNSQRFMCILNKAFALDITRLAVFLFHIFT